MAAAISCIGKRLKGVVTAEKIYAALRAGAWCDYVDEWSELFCSDDHAPWFNQGGNGNADSEPDGPGPVGDGAGASGDLSSDHDDSAGYSSPDCDDGAGLGPDAEGGPGANDQTEHAGEGTPRPDSSHSGESNRSQGFGAGYGEGVYLSDRAGAGMRQMSRPNLDAEKEGWTRVAKALAVNLQTYSKNRGKQLSGMVQELEESARERVDYVDFLRQFAIPGETLRISNDEFDYIFYTYGLRLYGNLPLIEPLEYREEKCIREFVIVIDTSGSVCGDIVKRFVDTTFDILKSTEAFFERVHVRIIECDAQVQSDDVITSLHELKEWGNTMKIHGGGGTDFAPAFAYVDKLVEDGEFENLGGLVYFTDGWGDYPDWMPEYKTAFVFYDEDYRPECVPPWAAQIVLDESAVDGMKYSI